ncbi:MAG: glycerophosphodiester phosphodiesterase family protein [Candidatus Latescibacterota bacterium]|nr:glycerophosphodiester phosphodiesterase family protein [Candidatus Latescibacterota bacterium]
MIHPLRIAHRGASGTGLAPENTLAAFEKAIQLGVDAIEIDVHATSDGEIVVIHDSTLDRTTDRSGSIDQFTRDEVRAADAGGWVNPRFRGERVPTLVEVLDLARHRVVVVIEIKADSIAERVLKTADDLVAQDQIVIQSFSAETVRRVNVLDSGTPTALLVGKLSTVPSRVHARRLVRQVLEVGANTLNVWQAALTPALLEELRKRGVSVWTWTVDDAVILRDVVELGVQGILTNYPDRLNAVLEELESEGAILMPPGRRQRIKPSRWGRRRRIRKQTRTRTHGS